MDKKLWTVFSEFIRLRDSDDNGFCSCITCGLVRFWRQMDCGHGVGRQHKAVKYNEKNNHAQCKKCNGFEGGRMDVYKEEVNKRYGQNAWDLLLVASRRPYKFSKFEVDLLTAEYKTKVAAFKKEKGL